MSSIPFLFAVLFASAIVKLLQLITKDKGSLFFKQTRIGLNGKPFEILKFRTMVRDADVVLGDILTDKKMKEEWEKSQKLERDPRITKAGWLLRKLSIDELPQFWNVLIGEMSCIGPRPLIPGELEYHGGKPDIYQSLKPGITSWWACNGRTALSYGERLELEYYYIEHFSFELDIKTFFRTIKTVLVSRNGC